MASDSLSPAGSSTYSSNTMYVGDGTWDSSRNDFLLPNLMGLNFDTMRYNGMGNRFATMPGYYNLIVGHAVLAVITFLFIVPTAILTARFYGRSPGWALRWHIYLQILTVGLTTVVFVLGWFAVGSNRSLTNPHHGIGLAIYVLVLAQVIGASWIHRREKGRSRRRLPLKLILHQWLGRSTALLGIAQVPLGLTLYGSPKWTFIIYALWMAFLVTLYFVLSYRARPTINGDVRESSHGGTVISDKKPSGFGGFLGPLVAGAGAAALLSGRRRSGSRSRGDEVVPSRRGSGSYIEDEKYESRRRDGGGVMNKLLKGAAIVGAGGLAKSWYDRRQRRKDDGSDYTSVAPDTPSRRPSRRHHHTESVYTEGTRLEEGRRPRTPISPRPGDRVTAAAALSAAEARPVTPRPVRPHSSRRRSSYETFSDDYTNVSDSPSRRPNKSGGVGKGLLAGLGLAWLGKQMADRRENKKLTLQDRAERERLEDERRRRTGGSRYTGDGFSTPMRKTHRPASTDMSSELSSIIPPDPHQIRPGTANIIPPVPAETMGQSRSRYDITETVTMPHAPPDPQGVLHQSDSGSEAYVSAGGRPHRRPSERRRRQGDRAAAEAVAAAAGLAAEEEARRRRSRSRVGSGAVESPPVSVKVKMHGDKDRKVTLRRLTGAEAAAERGTSKTRPGRSKADSLSSMSGSEVGPHRSQRYRRSERAAEREAEREAERRAESMLPPTMTPLNPPNPAFAQGKRPVKDSGYYSGAVPGAGEPSRLGGGGTSVGSPDSHGTWSEMSPSGAGVRPTGSAAGASADERRRRRRQERNRQSTGGAPLGTVEFT
ncbi:hypothetical protein BJ875DRAFT_38490 [Amylocarpus encephaloides]|uniref:Cytochrome b561 domain-containing protein n=1 Tax=Amylocarpus encephaloides TaxID=45428 RepID=A0A9P7YHH6_9HELO|nr:hypothetical protein BJ875DRAFT_38490 [Amylocarpus encephaloides]